MCLGKNIDKSWLKRLQHEFKKPYMKMLSDFIKQEKDAGKRIYPPAEQYFRALNLTPFEDVKVVILGQDPYHKEGQAHGLCFSVAEDVRIPPSLLNVYKELEHDLGVKRPENGDLSHWARQGVLLLNSVLSVEAGHAASHQGKGWEHFTDEIIRLINAEKIHIVFILWGNYAHKKGACIDEGKHLIIQAAHPSPLSAHRGFFGQRYFSRTNAYLQETGQVPIAWMLEKEDKQKELF